MWLLEAKVRLFIAYESEADKKATPETIRTP
jgi:hypothetical protein